MSGRHLLVPGCLLLLCLSGAVASSCDMEGMEGDATATSAATTGRAGAARRSRRYTHTGIDPATIFVSGSLLVLAGLSLRYRRR